LILTDRRRITGRLIEANTQRVLLEVGGVPTSFPVEQVEAIRQVPSVQDRYEELRKAIGDADAEGMLRLAEWCRARGRLDLAKAQVERALKLEPFNPQGKELQTIILAQIDIERRKPAPKAPPKPPADQASKENPAQPASSPAGKPAAGGFDPEDFPVLSADEVNLIRVYEVDLKDPPPIIIRRETVERFLETYGGNVVAGKGTVPAGGEARERFFRLKPVEQLDWFFALRARELYGEVDVMDDPKAMKTWRERINSGWLTNSCATSRCHGGDDAGRLMLTNRRSASDTAAYTNFLIVERFKTKTGLPLIDYKEPARSPLLQAGLPVDQATVFKHPEVAGMGRRWTPLFDSPMDPRYRQAVDWIRSMFPNRAEYPVDYVPPQPPGVSEAASPPVPPQPR
jgi:hypothetical protein